MKTPEHEQNKVPRLHRDIKAMNGKSTKRLTKCIDALSDLLDDTKHEVADDSSANDGAWTE